ncbi:phosphotransferase [Brevibacterium luteolum]|uniref:phosphotransferase n=1 Tax=Brevibacterium luteolum TaxID=199591 RepID=UPI003B67A363
MDTLGLRLAAIAAGQIAGFEPSLWTKLPDSRGPRVLLSAEDRSLVVSLIPDSDVPAAQTEAVACAVLRSLLPDTQIGFPQILSTVRAPDDLTEDDRTYEVQISDPLAGTPATLEAFAESQQLVSALADFLADLHNSDTGAVADAGLVVHDSAELREQLLADLDRAAGTGLVPAVLLQRWEDALENVSTWRFLPCPIHAALAPEAIRVDDGRITSVSDFFRFRVGDPAADLAAVSTFVEGSHYEHFLDRYRQQRDIKDAGLQARAELLAELAVLDWLLLAVDTEDETAKSDAVALLNSLAEVATADAEQPRHAQPYEFTDRREALADDAATHEEDAPAPGSSEDTPAGNTPAADTPAVDTSADDEPGAASPGLSAPDLQPRVEPQVQRSSDPDTFRPAADLAPFHEGISADVPTERIMDLDEQPQESGERPEKS